jgi:hypothetical protein
LPIFAIDHDLTCAFFPGSSVAAATIVVRDIPEQSWIACNCHFEQPATVNRKWPLEKLRTSPVTAQTRLTTRSGRAATCGDSPLGQPARAFLTNVKGQAAFIPTVIPFDEIAVDVEESFIRSPTPRRVRHI